MSRVKNNENIQIIPLQIGHILEVKSILDNQFGFDYISVNELKNKLNNPNNLCLVAKKGTEILGISVAIIGKSDELSHHLLEKKDWFINEFKDKKLIGVRKQMAVKKTYQGKGVGTQLMNESIHILNKTCDVIVTIVWNQGDSQIMEKLMKKNQFRPILLIANYWKNDSIKMKYNCSVCQIIPCTCSATIYRRDNFK
jgi:ribosomal protein S18 acetylase RimI-like enzyme